MTIERVFSGAPWEEKAGYCRAVRAGHRIHVTGTAAVDEQGKTFTPGNAAAQTRRCLELIDPQMLIEIEAEAYIAETPEPAAHGVSD